MTQHDNQTENQTLQSESRDFPEYVPDVVFKTRVRDESIVGENPFRWEEVSTDDIFKGRKVIVVALPGAFTPTCSSTHLPGYEEQYDQFKPYGIDDIYCVAVNDAFVMYQWSKKLDVEKVKMLPDGNADFTNGMNMLVKKNNLGFGDRSWRYSMLVDDKKIVKIFAEPNLSDNCPSDPFEVSDALTMLDFLAQQTS
ncbi:peroxiredoxin [Alkanindiges illinoisensis]|uniref:peroxiredoxin n=1 Tax=Alkanindiges illinoisensis TaxID=197183 RepID=UPI0009FEDD1D|nr:peroxiredoxin [Alkanindiges illinoisensis]